MHTKQRYYKENKGDMTCIKMPQSINRWQCVNIVHRIVQFGHGCNKCLLLHKHIGEYKAMVVCVVRKFICLCIIFYVCLFLLIYFPLPLSITDLPINFWSYILYFFLCSFSKLSLHISNLCLNINSIETHFYSNVISVS